MVSPGTPGHKDIVRITALNVRNVETTNQIVRINGVKYVVPVNGMRNYADLQAQETVPLPYMVCEVMKQAGIEANIG